MALDDELAVEDECFAGQQAITVLEPLAGPPDGGRPDGGPGQSDEEDD